MAKMTLLEMVQDIMSAMESDSVNSISDTQESSDIAKEIKNTYFDLISSRDWPFLNVYTTLTALGDTANPTKMRFPTNVDKVFWIKYNKKDVTYQDPKTFVDAKDRRTETTGVVDANGYIINRDPLYWTSFDDDYVFFDSYDSTVEATLQASKSQAYMLSVPEWTASDSFIPSLPNKMFPTFLADAKETCFLNFKQTSQNKESRKAQRGRVRMQNETWRNNQAESKNNSDVDYGRK